MTTGHDWCGAGATPWGLFGPLAEPTGLYHLAGQQLTAVDSLLPARDGQGAPTLHFHKSRASGGTDPNGISLFADLSPVLRTFPGSVLHHGPEHRIGGNQWRRPRRTRTADARFACRVDRGADGVAAGLGDGDRRAPRFPSVDEVDVVQFQGAAVVLKGGAWRGGFRHSS